jgi:ectoine hydroxylase-related dioxygenase (phytanoyl-CoA dioxygenase family)
MVAVDCKKNARWLELALEGLKHRGFAIVTNVVGYELLDATRSAMYRVQAKILEEIGAERLHTAGELGVLRLMLKHEPVFFRFLEIPEILAIVDQTVSETAILHLQNGFILPTFPKGETPRLPQVRFHQDFPRVLNGYLLSVNILIAVDAFSRENGGTLVVPGTHQKQTPPLASFMEEYAIPAECPAGSMLVFDSTLWHAAGPNRSDHDRLAINHQFTRSYLKQQIDYIRALHSDVVLQQPPRTQQLLGWFTRVVTSLDEYYQPEEKRLYRRGQG